MLSVLSLTLFLAGGAAAQTGPAGKWEESTSSGLNAALNLTATDTTLAGTFTIRARPMTITDGKITKNTLTFKAALEGQPEGFSGELKGDELELWRDRNGRTDAITLKRVKAGLVGKWQGQTPNGMSLALDLTGDDRSFRGTLTREGETMPITDGTISKNTFTFKVTIESQVENIEGTWENDQLKAWLTRQGPERTAVLTRVVK